MKKKAFICPSESDLERINRGKNQGVFKTLNADMYKQKIACLNKGANAQDFQNARFDLKI